jgi:hypothetical protein
MKFYVLLMLLLAVGCTSVSPKSPIVFPNGVEVTYIFTDYKHFLGGNSMSAIDRWKYDPKAGTVTLERADSTSSSSKLSDLVKNLPIPAPL